MSDQITLLAKRLEDASVAYHNGTPVMSDAAYDLLEDELRKLDPDHTTLAKVGAPTGKGWPKVQHPLPMGSLNKAQTNTEFLDWFLALPPQSRVETFVSEKLDGMSLLLTYEKGTLVRAATRGDGAEGEDITRNVRIMKGVPSSIPTQGLAFVRGEVVCLKSVFATHFQGDKNPRNTATGTSKRQKTDWRKAQHLTFIAYNLTGPSMGGPAANASTRLEEFKTLQQWGFRVPNHEVCRDAAAVTSCRDRYVSSIRNSLDYLIDGLVVEVNDSTLRENLGDTNMRPKGAIAFKFEAEEQTTILRDVKWQVGNSGRVTPVAEFDTVLLAGALVSRASIHNVARLRKLKLFVGCQILVSRRNDVIPFVECNIDEGVAYDD